MKVLQIMADRAKLISILAVILLPITNSHALDLAGRIKTASDPAIISNQGQSRDAKVGEAIYIGDQIKTKSKGAVGITFIDGAVMSIGPNSKVTINEFLFKPDTKEVGFDAKIMKGAMSFISGAIGRIAPEKVKIKTPTATLGLRGTKILVEVKSNNPLNKVQPLTEGTSAK